MHCAFGLGDLQLLQLRLRGCPQWAAQLSIEALELLHLELKINTYVVCIGVEVVDCEREGQNMSQDVISIPLGHQTIASLVRLTGPLVKRSDSLILGKSSSKASNKLSTELRNQIPQFLGPGYLQRAAGLQAFPPPHEQTKIL